MRRGKEPANLSESGKIGISWATSGGEVSGTLNDNTLAADGIENCMRILEDLEDEKITHNLQFVELNACPGGCVAGAGTLLPVDLASKVVGRYQSEAKRESPLDSEYKDQGKALEE